MPIIGARPPVYGVGAAPAQIEREITSFMISLVPP
jgi:hypothetical protein